MRIEADEGLSSLLASREEVKCCGGFQFIEGPVWVPEAGCLLFSDLQTHRMHRWRPGAPEADVYRDPSHQANGNTLDRAGNVITCEQHERRLVRAPFEGAPTTIVSHYEGKRFNSPNDVAVHSNGRIYFSDPTYGLPQPGTPEADAPERQKELPFQGVFRVDPDGALTLLVDDFDQPNGLAFSPDESLLYINDSGRNLIRRFRVEPDGSLSGGEIFVDMQRDERARRPLGGFYGDAPGYADGMRVDSDGRIWTTGVGGVWVIAPDGQRLGVFEIAEHPANLAFGGPDFSTLYLTGITSIYRVETAVRGIAPGSSG